MKQIKTIKYYSLLIMLCFSQYSFSRCVCCMTGSGCVTFVNNCKDYRGLQEMANANGLGWGCVDFKTIGPLIVNEDGPVNIKIDGELKKLGSDKFEKFVTEIVRLIEVKSIDKKTFLIKYNSFLINDDKKISKERIERIANDFNVKIEYEQPTILNQKGIKEAGIKINDERVKTDTIISNQTTEGKGKVKTKSNSPNERMANSNVNDSKKGWNGKGWNGITMQGNICSFCGQENPVDHPQCMNAATANKKEVMVTNTFNNVINKVENIKIIASGINTSDGIPIVNGRTVLGILQMKDGNSNAGVTVTISQTYSKDKATSTTDANGIFVLNLAMDTTHIISVNNADYGTVKLVSTDNKPKALLLNGDNHILSKTIFPYLKSDIILFTYEGKKDKVKKIKPIQPIMISIYSKGGNIITKNDSLSIAYKIMQSENGEFYGLPFVVINPNCRTGYSNDIGCDNCNGCDEGGCGGTNFCYRLLPLDKPTPLISKTGSTNHTEYERKIFGIPQKLSSFNYSTMYNNQEVIVKIEYDKKNIGNSNIQ